MHAGNSLVVQWLGFHAFTARAQVQSLVRELRFCQSHSVAKKYFFIQKKTPVISLNGKQYEKIYVCVYNRITLLYG